MIHLKRSLEIDAPREVIWAIISQFMQIDEISPRIAQVEALTHGASGVGSKRRCYFENGASLIEEVTEWNINRGYTVRLFEMSAMPLTEASAAILIEPLGKACANVVWSMDYTVKHGLLGWVLGHTLMKLMMTRVLDGNLKALADKVSSGRVPDAQPAYS